MSEPRMIPADDARMILEAKSQTGDHGFSFLDTYVRDLAHTAVEQDAQIRRVREVLDYLEKSYKHKNEIKYSRYGEGYVDGLGVAIRRLEKALGVDDE